MMKRVLFVISILSLFIPGSNSTSSTKQTDAPIMLQATEILVENTLALASDPNRKKGRFYVFHNDSLVIYDKEWDVISRISTSGNFYPTDPVIGSRGNIHLINSATDEIASLTPSGEWIGSFGVQERPFSLAVLSNGNFVVASPYNGKLIHFYDASGHRLRSFGDVKVFDVTNEVQNLFLNQGKVVVDSSDNIYYVFRYSPTPTVMKFSPKGKLLTEFALNGYSIDLQVSHTRKYLATKETNDIGGFVITNSAAIDPSTGHLWICMNGSSRAGVVYEYSSTGKKLNEYSFISQLSSVQPFMLTSVTDISIRGSSLYITLGSSVYLVPLDKRVSPGDILVAQDNCPSGQSWPECPVNCPIGSCPSSKNCKSTLLAQVPAGYVIIGSTCQSLGPGQGTPPEPNGGCIATVTTCNPADGEQVTHSTNQNCNPVKYACVGTNCVVDCNGTFTTSNCNNTCTVGGNGCFGICEPPEFCKNGFCCCTPILIDTAGNGFDLTNRAGGVNFDIAATGESNLISWTNSGSDDAWLVLDRNGNGVIDDGSELFGSSSPQPQSVKPNGFIALAEYDKVENGGNGDGRISSEDSAFTSLKLWKDTNHNGISEFNEMSSLTESKIEAFDLNYVESKRRDRNGNLFHYRAKITDGRGRQLGRWAWDVS